MSINDAVIYIVPSMFMPYGSKVETHYRSTLFADLTLEITHYFYNSKTRCDRQKQIAFLKSALKSMFIKKEK